MGQKINPIIFRLSKTNNWKSKYFEKKYSESVVYNFKDIEIRKFVTRFFEYNGLTIHNIKISYFNNTLHIFASYFSTLRTISLINTNNKNKKIRIVAKNVNTKNYKEYIKVKKNIKKYIKYEELNYIKNNFFYNKKIIINKEKQDLKLRRLRGLKYYKNYLSTKHYKDIFNIKTNSFLTKLFESLAKFTDNKINISLTLNKLNNDIKQDITKKNLKILRNNLIKLRRYEQNEFFKEGINILFLCTTRKNSAKLLSNFISIQLKKLKRHNFFLRFIKNTLVLFNNKTFSKIEGIKIKIKGRFNRAPRARHRIIEIGNGVPVLTLNSKIDYAESTSFTPNGTFGVKVWIYEKD